MGGVRGEEGRRVPVSDLLGRVVRLRGRVKYLDVEAGGGVLRSPLSGRRGVVYCVSAWVPSEGAAL